MTRTREVAIFVRRGDEFLVLHRSPENDAYWHVVAGGVEEGESFAAAAARELAEETGLVVDLLPLGRPFRYDAVDVDCYVADAPAGWEPQLDWEHDGYRWCTAADGAAMLHWPEPADVLRGLA